MADLLTRRNVTWAVRVAVVAAVVAAVLLLSQGGDEPDDAGSSGGTPSAEATSASPAAPASPEEFCAAFRAFADANSQYLGAPGDDTAETLRSTGETLAGLTDPIGMSPGAQAALQQEVDGALAQVDDGVEVRSDVEPDPTAYEQYLTASCPA